MRSPSIQTTVSLRIPCQRLYNPQFLLVLQEIAVLKVLNISENQAAKSSQSQVYRPISLIHLRQQMVRNFESQDKKIILYLADVYGPLYINAKLLQDFYASHGLFTLLDDSCRDSVLYM